MRKSGYVWLHTDGEWTLAYYYEDFDAETWGFGFNIADGGGFIPENDLEDETEVFPAIIGFPFEIHRKLTR